MPDTEIIERIDDTIKVTIPSMYKVILYNDNVTTFDFVTDVLVHIFHKTTEEASEITRNIHEKGKGIAGAPYTREIAEEKVHETHMFARRNGFPLTATFEEL